MSKPNEKVVVTRQRTSDTGMYTVTKLVNRIEPTVGTEIGESQVRELISQAKSRPVFNGKLTVEIL